MTKCGSCGETMWLTPEGRFPEHPSQYKRGICGGSQLLPFGTLS